MSSGRSSTRQGPTGVPSGTGNSKKGSLSLVCPWDMMHSPSNRLAEPRKVATKGVVGRVYTSCGVPARSHGEKESARARATLCCSPPDT
jgi:hypothetical protein